MSIRLMSEVWRTNLATTEKMVLLVIADHANDEGTQSYPSQATIAQKASISIRTVQRVVNQLCALNYIRMFKHSGGSADCREDRRPHLYQINIAKLRGDTMTGRQDDAHGATLTTSTGRHSRPMNHPLESSKKLDKPNGLQVKELMTLYYENFTGELEPGRGQTAGQIQTALKQIDYEKLKVAVRQVALEGQVLSRNTLIHAIRRLNSPNQQPTPVPENYDPQEYVEAKKNAVPMPEELRKLLRSK